MTPEIERVIDPAFVVGLSRLPIDEVRARRRDAQSVENALSYVRRMVQGRLDIVGAELQRRRAGGDPADLSDLVYRLPDILAESRPGGLGNGPDSPGGGNMARPPLELEPDRAVTEALESRLDQLLDLANASSLGDLDSAGLLDLADRLAALEQQVSAHRSTLHDVIGALQVEITRRYRTGEASVDSLLS